MVNGRTMKAIDVFGSFAGREKEILLRYLPEHLLSGSHQKCPFCEGKRSFRYVGDSYGSGKVLCHRCCPSTEDWIETIVRYAGITYKQLRAELKPLMTNNGEQVEVAPQIDEKAMRALNVVGKMCRPISDNTIASEYMKHRGIDPALFYNHSEVLYCPELPFYYTGDDNRIKGAGSHPAIVAKVRTAKRGFSTFHRIYLNGDGTGKYAAPDGCSKKTMTPAKKYTGGGVWLKRPSDNTTKLVVTEGIEDAMFMMTHGQPFDCDDCAVVAAVSAGQMEKFQVPEIFHDLMIVGDNDASGTGQAAAWKLFKRARANGTKCDIWIAGHHYDSDYVGYDVSDYFGSCKT